VLSLGKGGAKERTSIIYAAKRKSNTGGKSNLKILRVLWVLKLANALRQLQTVCKGKQGRGVVSKGRDGNGIHGQGAGDSCVIAQRNAKRNDSVDLARETHSHSIENKFYREHSGWTV
jgi:hypothetical protein